MFIFIALVCVCIFWTFQFHWKRRRLIQLSWKVPGPVPLPFIGSAYIYLKGDAYAIAQRYMDLYYQYPDIAKVWMGPELYYVVSKPEYIEIILNSPHALDKPELYDYTKPLIGNGLITGPVKIWKRHRKMIAPTLNQKFFNQYSDVISHQCSILVDRLQKECGREIDHYKFLTNCSMDVIAGTIFGVPLSAQINDKGISHSVEKVFEIVFVRCFKVFYYFDFIFRWTALYKEQTENINIIKKLTLDFIEKKKEQLGSRVDTEDEARKQFLDLLVEKNLNNEFSQEELEDEVNTVFLAGYDTNATTVSFALMLLGMHQDIQQQIYEEVLQVLGPERSPTLDDLSKLKYTECVIKETLRLFPPAPIVSRIVEGDINLGDLILPKGSSIAISLVCLHRTEKYWKEPLKFDPDRFLPKKSSDRHPYTFLPFSGGPRNCIGMKFGMMAVKIMMASIIRRFKVTSPIKSVADIELTANIVLKPKDGFRLTFHPRSE